MAGRKLNPHTLAAFKQFAAKKADLENATAQQIADEWNASRPPEQHLKRRVVSWHLQRMREAALEKAGDHIANLTERTVNYLTGVTLASPLSVVYWDGKKVAVRDAAKLTPSEVSQVGFKVTGAGKDRQVEMTIDPSVKVRAAEKFLTYAHGKTVHFGNSSRIISKLTQAGDREGLERIAAGEDPVDVLIDRAPFLRAQTEAAAKDDAQAELEDD